MSGLPESKEKRVFNNILGAMGMMFVISGSSRLVTLILA